ncbi:MAG: amino acid permease [Actinobacteria bacterium]|nr:MAG: amino acid permease [Actinomycetota bacterium]
MSERKVGSVTYQEVGEDYFRQRGLRRHAGMWSLWALGVGAVISGEYYGWNFGLSTGGFGGLLVAGAIMAVMYYGLVYSIAEMSPALPHTGGAYSFARSAMGPWGGFLTGLAENMEYVITPAVVVGAMGLLMQTVVVGLFDVGGKFAADGTVTNIAWWNSLPFWWAVFYIIFVGINYIGIEATMRFTVTITVLSLAVLAFFFIAALVSGKVGTSNWTNIPTGGGDAPLATGGGPWFPFGISGIFKALPFAIWFYLAIEEVPLAAEESMDPRRDVPRGSVLAQHTLVIAAILTLFINTALPGGAFLFGGSAFPLLDGFKAIFAGEKIAYFFGLLFMIGLIASFFTIIFAYGRNTYSLSRAGYFPKFLSLTHGERKTPHVALIAGAVVGYAVAIFVFILQEHDLGAKIVAALLNMAVFAAVISYIFQSTSFVILRQKLPNIERPYRSRWGIPGAVVAGTLAAIALVSIFLNDAYRPGVYGVAIYYLLGVLYFAIAGRHRLVLSPEEEFALTQGEHGVPAQEGFVATAAEQEEILGGRAGGAPPPVSPPPSGGTAPPMAPPSE